MSGLRLILIGAPGSGKGSQAVEISKQLGVAHLSTGDMLRAERANGSELGKLAQGYMDKGELVPDNVIIDMMKTRLQLSDCKNGYILDGFPRTVVQATAMEQAGIDVDRVILLEVPDEIIIDRLGGREVCSSKGCGSTYHIKNKMPNKAGICDECGGALIKRPDDNPQTVKNRLETYHEQTKPVLEHYRQQGKLLEVNGVGTVDDVRARVLEALNQRFN